MKKNHLILLIAAVVITACQQTPKTVSVDMEAEKAALDSIFDKFYSAFNEKDVGTLASYLTEDALCLGTDPSEFWDKQQITDLWTQMLADSVPAINFIGERVIKIAPDGNSAVAVDQYIMPGSSPKIPWRNVYHLVKSNDHWMILFFSCGFIPKNEDIQKINDAVD
jgi:ketosteroid isomerase-like protein